MVCYIVLICDTLTSDTVTLAGVVETMGDQEWSVLHCYQRLTHQWRQSRDNDQCWMLVTGQGGGHWTTLWQHKQNILILTRCHLQPQLTMTKQFTFSFPVLTITTICFMSRCHLTILNWNKKNVLFILLEDKCQKITTFTDSNGWMRMGMKIKWQKLQLLATVGNWNILLDSGQLYWRKFGQK